MTAPAPEQPARRSRDHGGNPDGRPARLADLFVAELHRFSARRFLRWLLGLAVLGYLVVVPLVGVTVFARTDDAMRAEARQTIARLMADQDRFREECLKGPLPEGAPADADPEQFCPPPASAADYRVEDFLPKRPFVLAEALEPGALAVGIAVAALFFVVGATWVGAEWSARTMTALLFWETRRLRVLAVKSGVLVLVTAVFAALAQVAWVLTARGLAATRGTASGLPKGFWGDVAAVGGRNVLLAVLVALLGTGVAHLIRGTGAALGVGFVYFLLVENAVGIFRPGWREWLLSTNAAALVLKGGTTIAVPARTVDQGSGQVTEFVEKNVSNLHGGLVLGGVAVGLLVLGGWLFRRRDLT